MRWFVSDLHFFHNLVWKKYRNKYQTMEEMHNSIIQTWNKAIKSKDTVYILGDVSFGKSEETKEIIKKLNFSNLILIRGNHDSRFSSKEILDLGFTDVYDLQEITLNKEKVLLYHYPFGSQFKNLFYRWYNKILYNRNEAKYYKKYLTFKGTNLIHGHVHDKPLETGHTFNVAWDLHQRPISEYEIIEYFNKQNKKSKLLKLLSFIKLFLW